MIQEELREKDKYLQCMTDIFEEMDTDGTGFISLDEFEEKLDDDQVIAYFSTLKLDVSDARLLFKLLDHDRSDEVNITEFITGCYKLQGDARSLDTKLMRCEVNAIWESVIGL